ncbi:MAG: dTMP kinase [Candidatus Adiutrix intracellularis]|jgi:TatD DNase family protein|nr:dTMP kinase [Candidatus Adiutrix intracellularis]
MNFKKALSLAAPGVNRGFFIALEGLDGAGKTTLTAQLAAALRAHGLNPLATKEPTEGTYGRKIRELVQTNRRSLTPKQELDYFTRDRAKDVAENIGPALLAGRPVLTDRYILSNIAYQSARGLPEADILSANRLFPWPDLIIIIEIEVAEGLARIANRPGGRQPGFEEASYLAQVKESFDHQNFENILRVDSQAEPQDIINLILTELRRRNLLFDHPPRFIDSHCHLSGPEFTMDLSEVLQRARAAGVTDFLNVSLNLDEFENALNLAEKDSHLHPVLGWHPHEAETLTPARLQYLLKLAQRPQVVAFGEIGLDFALMRSPQKTQLRVFETLLEAAGDLDRPVVIHNREATPETLTLLRKYAPRLRRGGVIHCFTLGAAEAEAYLELGFYLSLPGVLTYPKNQALRETVRDLPTERLLVETDAPYLAPAPFRGGRNEPAHLIWTLKALAEAKGWPLIKTADQTSANARRLFQLP